MQTGATTPNIVGPTMLGVVTSVCRYLKSLILTSDASITTMFSLAIIICSRWRNVHAQAPKYNVLVWTEDIMNKIIYMWRDKRIGEHNFLIPSVTRWRAPKTKIMDPVPSHKARHTMTVRATNIRLGYSENRLASTMNVFLCFSSH